MHRLYGGEVLSSWPSGPHIGVGNNKVLDISDQSEVTIRNEGVGSSLPDPGKVTLSPIFPRGKSRGHKRRRRLTFQLRLGVDYVSRVFP